MALIIRAGDISEVKLSELQKDLDELDNELHAIWNVLETQVSEHNVQRYILCCWVKN